MTETFEPFEGLSHQAALAAFSDQSLFENKTWRYSPEAFPLTGAQLKEIDLIGQACFDFYRAQETLYLRSAEGKSLLRNREFKAPWVAQYLDRGKPIELIQHARSQAQRGSLPMVIRPDLLITEDGFAMSEIDSVPGGIGLTAFLNGLYRDIHGEALVGAGAQNMIAAFYRALSSRVPAQSNPFIAIVVSDEAATYRPEMNWLAQQLRQRGHLVRVFHPDELRPQGDVVCVDDAGELRVVDVIYRFWELFDLANVSIADFLLQARGTVALPVSPPMRPFQEEKLSLALFHHHMLQDYWRESLPKKSYRVLNKVIPRSWVIDPLALPPGAVLDGPLLSGQPIYDWKQLTLAGKKERDLIIKISGFHESAWGARSVTLGSDSSRAEWDAAIRQAITMADTSLHIVQTYHKPKRVQHPVYLQDGSAIYSMQGRVRLCPYYFVDGKQQQVELHGVLATLCPADKKIIHGMKDAALLPCVQVD